MRSLAVLFFAIFLGLATAPPFRLVSAAAAPTDNSSPARSNSSSVVLTEVQATSLIVAYWRHLETQRDALGPPERPPPSPPLIQDTFARILLDKLGMGHDEHVAGWKDSPVLPFGINCMAVRTRTIDDWLMEGSGSGVGRRKKQVVNLGAGMCTRPYRLEWDKRDGQEVTVYEVEKDVSLLGAKRAALEDHPIKCSRLIDVEGDVTSTGDDGFDKALLRAGFDPTIPTDWIAEGLLEYLPVEAHVRIFKGTHKLSALNSRFVAWNGDPWCKDWCDMIGVSFPHVGFQTISESKSNMREAGWSKNVTVLDDDLFWPMYKRAMNVPLYLVLAEYDETTLRDTGSEL